MVLLVAFVKPSRPEPPSPAYGSKPVSHESPEATW